MEGIISNNVTVVEEMNGTESSPRIHERSAYDKNIAIFWIASAFCLFVALIAIIGNCLVLFATHGTKNSGQLRYLDNTIKSLAIADMLFGLIGIPLLIFAYYVGKF